MDNPALHQGRQRTTPHVEGQFAAHVYIPVTVSKKSRLFGLLSRIFSAAQESVPILHPIGFTKADADAAREGPSNSDDGHVELHISLTRPTYLRAHQREEFRRAIQAIARTRVKFVCAPSYLSHGDISLTDLAPGFLHLSRLYPN